ncbi:MAG: hypothetical protein ACOX5G_02370 [Kiritimatiellia bacterium]|jgi:hypothetical protein
MKNIIQTRNYEQSMGLWLNERLALHPDRIVHFVNGILDDGHDIIRILLRRTNLSHQSPTVIAAVTVAVQTAHARGARVVMDFEPHASIARAMGERYPSTYRIKLVPCRCKVVDGNWTVRIPIPALLSPIPIQDGVEAAFLNGKFVELPNADFQYASDNFGYAFTRDDHEYVENKVARSDGGIPADHRGVLWGLSGTFPSETNGDLLLFYRVLDLGLSDFADPNFRKYYTELLEAYRETDLDGVGWDEPGCGGGWDSYLYGDAFRAYFQKMHGYSPVEKLQLLEGPATPEAIRFRLDFYRAQNESLFEAQKQLIEDAARIFGKPMITGTHHTWQGEGGINDLRSCAVDYFRLTEILDAGYTDCSWWDHRSVCYAYILGKALARLTPTGEIVANTWHYHPSIRNSRYNGRLLSLLRITWFNICYGETADTCMYPSHYTYPAQAEEMRRNRDFLRATAGVKPLTEIAVLHDWENVCALNLAPVANLHKGFLLNIATQSVDRSFPLEFIDTRMLADSVVCNGRLENISGDFSTVIIPHGAVIRHDSWKKLREFGRAGGTVIFAGAPPTTTCEGDDISGEFAKLFSMSPVPFAKYHEWFTSNYQPMPTGRPEAYDAAYFTDAPLQDVDGENRRAIVHSACDRFHWFTGYLPSLDLSDFLLRRWMPPAKVFAKTPCQYQFYRKDDDMFLCGISPDETPLQIVLENNGALRAVGGSTFLWEKL